MKPEVGPDPARLGHLVRRIAEQALRADWSAVFARIEEIDQRKLRATVKPLVQLPTGDGQKAEIGPIYHVPVDFDRAGPFYVRRPYQPKDIVLLTIHDVSLERVLLDHEPQDPGLRHVGALHDAVAHGGYRAESDPPLPAIWAEDWLQQNTDTMDTLVWYKRGGVQWILPGSDGNYSFRLDGRDAVRLASCASELVLHAAQRIQVGEGASYRALLAEPVIATYNAHVHICPACGMPTSPPLQSMSLGAHASQLVWLRKDVPGSSPLPYEGGLFGHAPVPPAEVAWDATGLLGAVAEAGLNVATEAVEGALQSAYGCLCTGCRKATGSLGACVGAAMRKAGEAFGAAAQRVLETAVSVAKDRILRDPMGFLRQLFTNPVGLAGEIAAETLGRFAGELMGVDVNRLVQDAVAGLQRWALNAMADAVRGTLQGLGLEGAAKVVQAIQAGVNVAQQTGSWAKGVAAGINALGGNEAQTTAYLAGTILGAVEAAAGT